jgi:hypothetical protein
VTIFHRFGEKHVVNLGRCMGGAQRAIFQVTTGPFGQ